MSTGTDPTEDAQRVAMEGLADCRDEDSFDAGDPEPGDRGPGGGGGRFLTDLADVLRAAGLSVEEHDGWQQRHRSSGGYNGGPVGIIVHHTASPASWDGQRDVDFIAVGCDVAPMANLYLDRKGQWWVLAAGASNTNGKGGPWGPLPLDSANSRVIGIEAGNDGVGEAWPDVMQDVVRRRRGRAGQPLRRRHRQRPGPPRVGAGPQGRSGGTEPLRRHQRREELGHGQLPRCRRCQAGQPEPAARHPDRPAEGEHDRRDLRRAAGRRVVVDRAEGDG